MARILRGDIRWADLNPVRGRAQAGQRPVLVLSHDVFNERSGTVIAVAMTSQEPRAGFPLTLESRAAGLPKRSWIKISQIRTLSVEEYSLLHAVDFRHRVETSILPALWAGKTVLADRYLFTALARDSASSNGVVSSSLVNDAHPRPPLK